MIVDLAWALLVAVASSSWRHSRAISAAVLLAFLARPIYLETHIEALRLVSLVVGSAGVYELCKWSANACLVFPGELPNWSPLPLGRVPRIALLCIASAAVDGVAWLGFPYGLAWSQPWIQSAVCVAIVGLCEWPKKEGAT